MSQYNRSRSTGGETFEEIEYIRNGSVLATLNPLVSKTTHSMQGVDIGNYNARKKRGELLPHTAFHEEIHDSHLGTFAHHAYSDIEDVITEDTMNGKFLHYGNWQASNLSIYSDIQEVDEHLVQRAAAKIYSRGHDTLTFLAELHKTVRMFRNVGKSMQSILDIASKEGISNLSDIWLQYRYGWRILYFEIEDLNEVINELDDSKKRFSQRTGVTNSNSSSYRIDTPADANHTIHFDVIDSWEISKRGFVTADVSPPKFQFNPATTAWELVKYSFIIDWFLDVGTWLESLSFLAIEQNYEASYGYHLTVTRDIVETSSHNTAYIWSQVGSSRSKIIVKHREPTSLSYSPQTTINLDGAKIADVMALLARFISR